MKPSDAATTLAGVCAYIAEDRLEEAAAILRQDYPFQPVPRQTRNNTPLQSAPIFLRDGFIDRYSGKRLVFPGTLRLLSKLLPIEFPYHNSWKMDACHFAFWELFPTIDHIVPVTRGGVDAASNWVSTSMLRNGAKANFTLEELGWALLPPGDSASWDGLMGWFLDQTEAHPSLLEDLYLRTWRNAAVSARSAAQMTSKPRSS